MNQCRTSGKGLSRRSTAVAAVVGVINAEGALMSNPFMLFIFRAKVPPRGDAQQPIQKEGLKVNFLLLLLDL